MSRVSELLREIPASVSEQQLVCVQCAEPVKRGGYWQGGQDVAICDHCAHDPAVLGALLADALLDSMWQGQTYSEVMDRRKQSLERLERAFWKAIAGGETARRTNVRREERN